MCVKVSVVGGKEVIENWEGGGGAMHLSVLYCVHFHRIKDGTGRKINQLDCNVLNASNRGEGMSHPRETFYTWQIITLLILSMSQCMNLWKDDNARDESWPSRNNYIVSMHMQYIYAIGLDNNHSTYMYMLSKPFHHVNVHNMVQENGEMRNF